MKNLKRLFIFILSICVFCIPVFYMNVYATETTFFNDKKTASYTTNVIEDRDLFPGTRYVHEGGHTTRDGRNINQNAFMLFQKSNESEGTKTVTWGVYSKDHTVSTAFPRATLANIAKDYELHHPGWKVIGGINADQYFWKYGTDLSIGADICENQPFYGFIADYENWFSIDCYGRIAPNLTAFKNDGSTDPLVYNNSGNVGQGFKLSIIKENGEVVKFNVDGFNPKTAVPANSTYVYALTDTGNTEGKPISRDNETKDKTISSTNDLYIINKADMAFMSNSTDYHWYKQKYGGRGVDAFFGKGEINKIAKETTIKATDFAIETTNPELLKELKMGAYVRVQYELAGGYENCEAGTGWHTIQRMNNVEQNVTGPYNTKGYPRSAFGVTNDGTIVLINGEGTFKSGWTGEELNALANAYGLKTLFQMDGGGSASMIIRDKDGNFKTCNKPSDGNDRQIFSGIFFVAKDIQSEVTPTTIASDSLEFNVKLTEPSENFNVKNMYMTLKGVTSSGKPYEKTEEVKNLNGSTITFDGLASNKEYTYSLSYKLEGKTELRQSLTGTVIKTAKKIFEIDKIEILYKEDLLNIRLYSYDKEKTIRLIKISFDGGKTYETVNGREFKIENFKGDPLRDISLLVFYDLNDGKDQQKVTLNNIKLDFTVDVFMSSMLYYSNDAILDIFK